MEKNFKTDFQEIHYGRKKPSFFLRLGLVLAEFGYGTIINLKNLLYKIRILNEKETGIWITCVGNLTTGGVGKTPIVIELANVLSQTRKVAIISRGYGAKLQNKNPNVIKDFKGLKFEDGTMCGDEPFQIAKKTKDNVVVITCADRKKAVEFALIKYGIDTVILDDGFSNRKIKKDKTIMVIDSAMRFGNNHLLPYGPLREPIREIKRADEIILVNKNDKNIDDAINWVKKFKKPVKIAQMQPKQIYNIQTKAQVKLNNKRAIAFCAIGQPEQFFDYAREYYDVIPIAFEDHHKYNQNDINELIETAKKNNISTFITTQKDETKLVPFVKEINNYSFNVLELETKILDI